jgi:hypothetical protein
LKLGYPISALKTAFNGQAQEFILSLREDAGWLKDPQNTLIAWTKPSKCDLLQVLSRLSSLMILGDWTTWHESVALDNVLISNIEGKKLSSLCSFIHTS